MADRKGTGWFSKEGLSSLVTARQDNVAEAGQTCLRMPRQDILSCLKCSDVLPRLNVLPRCVEVRQFDVLPQPIGENFSDKTVITRRGK